ncbi:unnamed protein product [Lymnaea stagnalis]|uniref:Beta-hexosaminidase n=1 Tax=Lymnaea stagnalis TaxID=6523 RepID=A0AAV2HWB8_LYMST
MSRNEITIVLVAFVAVWSLVSSEVDFIAERLPLQGRRPRPGSPWPMPEEWKPEDAVWTFVTDRLTLSSDTSCDIVHDAYQRFVQRLRNVESGTSPGDPDQPEGDEKPRNSSKVVALGSLHVVRVEVKDTTCPEFPQYGAQEDYDMVIGADVSLQASSVWGVVWGFETLGQLMYMVNGKWFINKAVIHDKPRFSHRGLHLDTARHFYSVDAIKKNLDVMSTNKLNVFHWHIVDAQSFPYESTTFPNLTLQGCVTQSEISTVQGAYSPRHVYKRADVRDIIRYARLRGVRILPEFDTPGHAHSWGKAYPELLTPCYDHDEKFKAVYSQHAERENFDPTRNSTFDFLSDFFAEVKETFVDTFLHMGMDEAHYMCWNSSLEITTFMADQGMTRGDFSRLESYYSQRLLDIVDHLDRRVLIWEDPINNGANVSLDAWIQVWKDKGQALGNTSTWQVYLKEAVAKGYNVIFSSCWYISKISYGQDWKNYYLCEPHNIDASQKELSLIKGGEACTWSEFIDESNFLSVIWPRASAVAERLWSPGHVNNTDDATFRLDQHRCRMLRQGIPAQPILPGFCQDDYNTDNSLMHHTPVLDSSTTQKPGNTAPGFGVPPGWTSKSLYIVAFVLFFFNF